MSSHPAHVALGGRFPDEERPGGTRVMASYLHYLTQVGGGGGAPHRDIIIRVRDETTLLWRADTCEVETLR